MPYWHQQLIHRPVADKLVGVAPFGRWHEPGTPNTTFQLSLATIRITNPNCDVPINLTQMSLIRHDGLLIYEGPFLATGVATRTPVDQMLPHRSFACQLRYCFPVATAVACIYGFPDPNDATHWLNMTQIATQAIAMYTVEIEWSAAAQEAQPPIAFLHEENLRHVSNALAHTSGSASQMVSLKHYKD